MKRASSEARNSAALATSQALPIPPLQRHRRVAPARVALALHAEAGGDGVDAHRRVDQAGEDRVDADAVLGVGLGQRQRQCVDRGLRHLVAVRRVAHRRGARHERGDRGDERDRTATALAQRRQRGLRHSSAPPALTRMISCQAAKSIHSAQPSPRPMPTLWCSTSRPPSRSRHARNDGGAVVLARDISDEHLSGAALGVDRRGGVRGGGTVAVEQHHARALAGEQERCGAPVADLLARRLARARDPARPCRRAAPSPALSPAPSSTNTTGERVAVSRREFALASAPWHRATSTLADRTWPLLRRLMGGHTTVYRLTGGLVGHRFPGAPPMLLLDHVGATQRQAPDQPARLRPRRRGRDPRSPRRAAIRRTRPGTTT